MKTYWTIWVRPLGSNLWTLSLKPCPFFFAVKQAEDRANELFDEYKDKGYCIAIRRVDLPDAPDELGSPRYVELMSRPMNWDHPATWN